MKVIKTIPAGEKGSRKFLEAWGEKLLNVRYRQDDLNDTVVTTLEIVVDERPKLSRGVQQKGYLASRNKAVVAIKIAIGETELRQRIKSLGGRWSKQLRLWLTTREKVVTIGLKDRIVSGAAEKCKDIDTSLIF